MHTRPYMTVKDSLADLYFYNGMVEDGVREYKELLELNPVYVISTSSVLFL